MEILKIALIGIGATVLAVYCKGLKSEYAVMISMTACCVIMFYIVSKLLQIFEIFEYLQTILPLEKEYLSVLVKMIGITYIAEFTSNICKDGGYQAIASQIEIFGKISVLAVSMPIFSALLKLIQEMLG
ncbi:MAG: stage III sporulation protein AD [Lachnospiraceae bacterium]|nr:stage III sporulation protein AD [Lachnospiraceae bacterium]